MSLRKKLASIFSLIVIIILIINNSLFYFTTEEQLIAENKEHMNLLAQQIGVAIDHSQYSANYAEELMGEKLYIASIAAKQMLPSDIDDVTNEQLIEISKQVGVSHITLFKDMGDDIVALKSSDQHEINLSTKEWGYWYTALRQLFQNQNVTIPEGQKLPNYWAGPLEISTSNPNHFDKWGYYYDGTTNYIINPYIRDPHIVTLKQQVGPEAIISHTLKNNPTILEITGFNIETFGEPPVYTIQNGVKLIEKSNEEIQFGSYKFSDSSDVKNVREVADTGEPFSFHTEINGKEVLKTYVPLSEVNANVKVIGVVMDYKVIQDVLYRQLLLQLMISIIILILIVVFSLSFSDYLVKPIHRIVKRVNEIGEGNYTEKLSVDRKDELGALSAQINKMSENLESYMLAEEMLIKSEKLSIAGQLAAGVAHEIRNPLTALKGFIQLMQRKDDENKKYLDIMTSELDRIEVIVSELLVLAKPQATQSKIKNYRNILTDVIALCESHAFISDVEIHTELPFDALIDCDENQLKQVFINILKNAIESMPKGGNLYITAIKTGEKTLELRFKDEGSGIPEEFISRIGEPFYTTKEKGTGLGLMVSNKIIQNHNGTMKFNSIVGEGTEVNISLPIIKGDIV